MRQMRLLMAAALMALCMPVVLAGNAKGGATDKEEDDNVINIVAYFCKNDTARYEYVEMKANVTDNDTTLTRRVDRTSTLIVTDSTSHCYMLDFIPGATDITGKKPAVNAALLLQKNLKGERLRLRLSELGEFQAIDNWNMVVNKMKETTATIADAEERTMFNKYCTYLNQSIESDATAAASLFPEISHLFNCHGLQLTLDESKSFVDSTSFIVPINFELHAFVDKEEETGLYLYGLESNSQGDMPTDKVSDLVGVIAKTMGLYEEGKMEEVQDMMRKFQKNPFKYNGDEYRAYFLDGWPKEIMLKKEIGGEGFMTIDAEYVTEIRE